ncbi:MAG TPA: DUF2378 family protein [Archangium sp.]|jgi:uncharacterized protein (TIGR02265 family)|uniref:DUF2378 family protein n=1 Tax=Archangium sp. TaxID=1872627 RepID=UPI002EDB7142
MSERLVFAHTVEGLFRRGLSGRIPPGLKEQLRQAGLDLERPLLPAYPLETWFQCVALAAETLYPGEPRDLALRRVGERMVDGYLETTMGSAMFGLLRLLGPQRTLGRMQKNLRSANNYTEARLTEVGPRELDLWMNEPGPLRYFMQGVLLAGLRGAGTPDVQVALHHFDDASVTYRVSWEGKA